MFRRCRHRQGGYAKIFLERCSDTQFAKTYICCNLFQERRDVCKQGVAVRETCPSFILRNNKLYFHCINKYVLYFICTLNLTEPTLLTSQVYVYCRLFIVACFNEILL